MIITRKAFLGGSDKKFKFLNGEVRDLDDDMNVLSISIDFPGGNDTQDSTFSLNLGTEQNLDLQFRFLRQDTDRSEGSHSEVKTFKEIITYLKRVMFRKAIGEVLYQLDYDTKFESVSAIYELKSFSFKTDKDLYPTGFMKFKFRRYIE